MSDNVKENINSSLAEDIKVIATKYLTKMKKKRKRDDFNKIFGWKKIWMQINSHKNLAIKARVLVHRTIPWIIEPLCFDSQAMQQAAHP